jgi:hypothetical protein
MSDQHERFNSTGGFRASLCYIEESMFYLDCDIMPMLDQYWQINTRSEVAIMKKGKNRRMLVNPARGEQYLQSKILIWLGAVG